jgi:hypothetical protein
MAIQPQIAMGFRPPQFESPLNMMSQFAQLQSAQQANALRQSQMQKMQLDEERRNALTMRAQSGAPLTFADVVPYGEQGFNALEAQQGQFKAQQEAQAKEQEQMRKRQGTLAQTLFNVRDDPSNENFQRMIKTLRQTGMDKGLEADIVELLTMDPDQRKIAVDRYIQTTPGMAEYITERGQKTAALGKTQAEIAKLGAETRGVGAVKPTSDIQNYRQAVEQGFTGSFFDYQTQLKKAGRTEVKVNTGENVEEGARRRSLVEEETRARTAAQAARKALVSVDSAERVLEAGFKTGFGTEVKTSAAAFLGALGVKDAEKFASQAQTFLKAAMDQVLARQLEQRGIQTNQDAQRMEQTFAQLGNTPEANRFVLALSRAQSNLAVEQDQFYRKWVKDNDTMKGAEDAWFEKQGDKSIFERPELKQYAPKKETPATAGGPVRLPKDNADEVYNSLPSGTVYIDPNGVQKRKR